MATTGEYPIGLTRPHATLAGRADARPTLATRTSPPTPTAGLLRHQAGTHEDAPCSTS